MLLQPPWGRRLRQRFEEQRAKAVNSYSVYMLAELCDRDVRPCTHRCASPYQMVLTGTDGVSSSVQGYMLRTSVPRCEPVCVKLSAPREKWKREHMRELYAPFRVVDVLGTIDLRACAPKLLITRSEVVSKFEWRRGQSATRCLCGAQRKQETACSLSDEVLILHGDAMQQTAKLVCVWPGRPCAVHRTFERRRVAEAVKRALNHTQQALPIAQDRHLWPPQLPADLVKLHLQCTLAKHVLHRWHTPQLHNVVIFSKEELEYACARAECVTCL